MRVPMRLSARAITGIGDVRSLDHAESDVRALLADTALARNGKFLLNGLNPTHPRCSTEVEHCNAQLIAELLSRARGTVAASFLETALASPGGESVASSSQQGLVIATTTVDKMRTVIRLGQTGMPEGLRQLSSTCEDSFPN